MWLGFIRTEFTGLIFHKHLKTDCHNKFGLFKFIFHKFGLFKLIFLDDCFSGFLTERRIIVVISSQITSFILAYLNLGPAYIP